METMNTFKEFLEYYKKCLTFYKEEIKRYKNLIELYETRIKFYNTAITQSTGLIRNKQNILRKLNTKIDKIEFLTCKICMENVSDCIIRPCLHFCCCLECMNKLIDPKCPMCRIPFDDYFRIYY